VVWCGVVCVSKDCVMVVVHRLWQHRQKVCGGCSQLPTCLVRGDWEAEANQYKTVLAAALEASSTDNEHQTISKYDTQPAWYCDLLPFGALC
jgi:hypothetical protein